MEQLTKEKSENNGKTEVGYVSLILVIIQNVQLGHGYVTTVPETVHLDEDPFET